MSLSDMLLDITKHAERIKKKIQVFDKHKSYQALLYSTIARFCKCDFFEQEKTINYLQEAQRLSSASAFEYKSSYRLGQYYEKIHAWNEAIYFYEKSLSMAPDEYRAVYKVAMYYWKQKKDKEKACKYFRRIDTILDNRYVNNLLQPREAEFLYKTWYFIREIIKENSNRAINGITAEDATRQMDNILARVKDVNHTNSIYTLIFGSDAQIDDIDPRYLKRDAREALAERIMLV